MKGKLLALSLFLFASSAWAGTVDVGTSGSVGGGGGGGGTPGGSDNQIQFNDASSFGGSTLRYVDTGDTLSTEVTAATAGDTLVFAPGTYTVSAAITNAKALHLYCPAGPYSTVFDNTTNQATMWTQTADNFSVEGCGFTGNAGKVFSVDGSAGSVLTNINFKNIRINQSTTISSTGIEYIDAGGDIRGLDCTLSTTAPTAGGSEQSKCVFKKTTSTAEADTTMNLWDSKLKCTIASAAGDQANTVSKCLMNWNNTADPSAQTTTLNAYDVSSQSINNSEGGALGMLCEDTLAVCNLYGGFYDGGLAHTGDVDISVSQSSTVNAYGTFLVNGTSGVSGTLNRYGRLFGAGLRLDALPTPATSGATPGLTAQPITITGGIGGASSVATTAVGGGGSAFTLTAGAGGVANSANTASTGGTGGDFDLTGAAGGDATVATGTNTGGEGSDITATAGAGGAASGGSSNTGGSGGDIALVSGAGGTGTETGGAGGTFALGGGDGASANGDGGDVNIYGGNAAGSGTDGDVLLNLTTAGTYQGKLGIGVASPTLNVGINGSTSNRTFGVERLTGAGTPGTFTINAAGAASGQSNTSGGTLQLSGGTATGSGSSAINFQVASSGASGTTDRSPATKMRLMETGLMVGSGSNPTATLFVDGTSNITQAVIQAHSTQTSNLLELETSSASEVFMVNNSGNVSASGTVVSTRTTDFGWSVVSGADTACNTTCTFACVFGQENTSKAILACTDATADVCLCAGAN